MERVRVAVLGATGNIGQRFVSLLDRHPYFETAMLCASSKSVGRPYKEFWRLEEEIPESVADMRTSEISPSDLKTNGIEVAFSGLPSDLAATVEEQCAHAGIKVFSNASAHRMDRYVPILIPEVNAQHIDLVKFQSYENGGFIVTNANCTITGLVIPLKPLLDAFSFRRVFVSSYQALSGAGYPGVPSLDISGNVLPFIEDEEEKMRVEARKILGYLKGDHVEDRDIEVEANCVRVNVREGHLEAVSIDMQEKVDEDEVASILSRFKSLPQEKGLPTAPTEPIILRRERDRPQPLLDANAGKPERARGMAVTVGRIRASSNCLRFFVLSHNTIRGGAGGSVLNAELARVLGYLG